MISELLKKTDIQSWSAISLQTALLTSNVILFYKGHQNSYIVISGVLILTLFCLQVISRRFLMFYPIQRFMNISTTKIDTTILRCTLIFAATFLAVGVLKSISPLLTLIDQHLILNLKYILPLILPLFPLLWHFFFDDLVRNNLVEELKSKQTTISVQCPNRDCQYPFAKAIKRVKSNSEGVIHIKCEICGNEYDKHEAINIGY
jgi:hypothetical protein